MIKPEVLDAMVAAGCTAEQIVAAVKADALSDGARANHKREIDAARKRRQRSNVTLGHADNAGQDVTAQDNPSPKKETSPTPPKEKTTPSSSETTPSSSETIVSSKTPRQALEVVLDAQRADAVIEHRKRIGKPVTVRAAELLAGKFARCPDPNAGADAMVSNGWQGFEPEWVDRQQQRGSPQARPPSKSDVFEGLKQQVRNGQQRDRDNPGPDGNRGQLLSLTGRAG